MSLLKAKRQQAGLSVSELARRVNMGMTRLWKIENGELRLKVDDVARLARALGCQPSDLIPPLDDEIEPLATPEEVPTHGN